MRLDQQQRQKLATMAVQLIAAEVQQESGVKEVEEAGPKVWKSTGGGGCEGGKEGGGVEKEAEKEKWAAMGWKWLDDEQEWEQVKVYRTTHKGAFLAELDLDQKRGKIITTWAAAPSTSTDEDWTSFGWIYDRIFDHWLKVDVRNTRHNGARLRRMRRISWEYVEEVWRAADGDGTAEGKAPMGSDGQWEG